MLQTAKSGVLNAVEAEEVCPEHAAPLQPPIQRVSGSLPLG